MNSEKGGVRFRELEVTERKEVLRAKLPSWGRIVGVGGKGIREAGGSKKRKEYFLQKGIYSY